MNRHTRVLALAVWALIAAPSPLRAAEQSAPPRVSITAEKADVRAVLSKLFQKVGANYVLDTAVKGEVDVRVDQKPFDEALAAVLDAVKDGPALTYTQESGVYRVAPAKTASEKKEAAEVRVETSQQDSAASQSTERPVIPPSEFYVVPAPPVAVQAATGSRLIVQQDRPLYVRVDYVLADPVWIPTGAGLPVAPVWTGAVRPVVQTELGAPAWDNPYGEYATLARTGIGHINTSRARGAGARRFGSWR